MEFAILGSGSAGNSSLLKYGDKTIMIDAGFSGKELLRRMEPLGVTFDMLDAILISHEHLDHLAGAGVVSRKVGTPIYIHEKSYLRDMYNADGTEKKSQKLKNIEPKLIVEDTPFEIGEITVTPFTSYHDAKKTLGFRFVAGGQVFVYLTDCGFISNKIKSYCLDADSLAIEFNYNREKLLIGTRPWQNKYRTLGRWGHLDNEETGKFLSWLLEKNKKLKKVFGMHLSAHHNEEEEIEKVLEDVQGIEEIFYITANRDEITTVDDNHWFKI